MTRIFTSILALLFVFSSSAQSFWSPVSESDFSAKGKRLIVPQKYRTVQLDLVGARNLLTNNANHKAMVTLPMPDGTSERFALLETPVMPHDLQTKYPQIRCFTGRGIDDPSALAKCDLTPQGFHAMIVSSRHSTVFIDPYSAEIPDKGVVYYKKDFTAKQFGATFACGAATDHLLHRETTKNEGQPEFQGDCMKRRYRLALACTGEYAAFHGGTKVLVMAAMNTSLNRVNGVYEREINVTFQLVPKNDTLIFLNGNTDPYTNNDGGAQLDENEATCNARIGFSNYDIGHVFSTDGGGIAGLGVVCTTGKARGATGGLMPIGDPFDIDYVVHEMGHQFSASHTQNNDCASSPISSMEPGSGSTIMGYAGICAPNVQNFGEDYFHSISLQQIGQFLTQGPGNTCGTKFSTGNTAPTVTAGADYTIPRSTPFALTATADDLDGDQLTYCWEQMDPETANMPPAATNVTGPLFRSFYPTVNPIRTFPRLPDLINNVTPMWEKLPSVARTMKFRVTVRDNQAGGGCTKEDDIVVTVTSNSGPFTVTSPNTNLTWTAGSTQTVTWNVAGTTAAPVSCANVRIRLSTDAGLTYPIVLANSAPNNGSADIIVPNFISNNCRVRVEGLGNIFFDISNQNFRTVAATTPTFTIALTPLETTACVGTSANYVLNVSSILGFSSPVTVSVTGAPAGATVTVNPPVVMPPGNVSISLMGMTNANAGAYALNITAASSTTVRNTIALLNVQPASPTAAPTINTPTNGAIDVSTAATLDWAAVQYATTYLIEVATLPSFTPASIVRTRTATTDSVMNVALNFGTVYYWRIRAQNTCGIGPYSTVFAFETTGATCNHVFSSTDVPKPISVQVASTVVSNLTIPDIETISDINVSMQINHSWVGDLNARLIAPNGTQVTLFDRPGFPASPVGCDGENLIATFDEEATTNADVFENTCGPNPAITGTFKPVQPLSLLRGGTTNGNWRLSVRDFEAGDGGSIESWSVSICYAVSIPAGNLLNNKQLDVARNAFGGIDSSKLKMAVSGMATQVRYTLLALPTNGSIQKNGQALAVGGVFTQADINNGLVRYLHNGNAANTDNFRFDAFDDNNDGWVHDAVFNVRILTNNLIATATRTGTILCNGQATGQITVNATGLNGQYQYALQGGAPQSSTVFSNLAGGTYTVIVTGQFGFTATGSPVTIANPSVISLTASVNTDDLTASATGGTGALTYSIGQNFQSSGLFENLANGPYTVTARDANGCTTTTQAIVAVNTLLASVAVTQQPRCTNESSGVITVTVGGGQVPFTYRLNNGLQQSGNVFSNLPSGGYFVVVRDAQGFETMTGAVQLTNPPALTLLTDVTFNAVTLTGAGGIGIRQYSINGTNFQNFGSFTGLANGNYTATVRDANGCIATTTFSISVAPLLNTLSMITAILCNGGSTGTISATANGGIPPYEFNLNGGLYQSNSQFSGLSAGTYTVTAKDAGGTTTPSTLTLTQPTVINAVASSSLNAIIVSASGGTGTIQYSLDGIIFQAINTFSPVANGNYTVVVRDANNCTATASVTVNVSALAATATVQQGITCNGQSDGRINASGSGGIPPYQYSLNNGTFQNSGLFVNLASGNYSVVVRDNVGSTASNLVPLVQPPPVTATASVNFNTITVSASGGSGAFQYSIDGTTFQPAATFNSVVNGTYTLTARDVNGCTGTTTATVNVSTLSGNVTVTQPLLCNGDANAGISVAAAGGVPPYQYSLNGSVFQSGNTYTNLSAGNFSLVVRDNAGNTTTSNVSVAQPPSIVASAAAVLNTVTVTASGGTGNLSYNLNGGAFQPSNVFNNVPNGTFSVIVRDANGCSATASVVVNVSALAGSISVGQPLLCHGDGNGSIMANATGGVPPYQFSLNSSTFQNGNVFAGLITGTYTITIKDGVGTTTSNSITLTDPPALVASGMVVFNVVTINAAGGTGALQYSLNGVNFQVSGVFNGVANGSYTAVVRDNNGCTALVPVTVNVPPLTSEVVLTQPIACFGNTTGVLQIAGMGGIPPYTYSINGGAYQNSNQFSDLTANAFSVAIRDATGTVITNTFTITEPAQLTVQAAANQNNLTLTALGGTGPYTFSLNGNPLPGPSASNLPNGTYAVVATDKNGCTATTSVTIMIIGTEDVIAKWQIRCTPNPGAGLFRLTAQEAPEQLSVRVVDISGKIMQQYFWAAVNGTLTEYIDLRHQPAGAYILHLSDGVQSSHLTLIKE